MKTAIPMRAQANEYGRCRLVTRDLPAILEGYATSPSFARVTVASGAMVTVLVIVIGVPVMLNLLSVTDGLCKELLVGEANMVEAELTKIHPFGEHCDSEGQHPPPVSAEH